MLKIKDYANLLKIKDYASLLKIKELKFYIIEYYKNSLIKPEFCLFDCIVKSKNYWPIIVITYDKYIFFANNKIQKV